MWLLFSSEDDSVEIGAGCFWGAKRGATYWMYKNQITTDNKINRTVLLSIIFSKPQIAQITQI